MGSFKDLTGETFNYYEVLGIDRKGSDGRYYYLCKCKCGKIKSIRSNALTTGNTTSCGCYRDEQVRASNSTHGDSGSAEFTIWVCMKQRCHNPTNHAYHRYGGRGITVCDRWRDSYEAFLEDMGRRPTFDAQIDRIDNEGNYEPSNCRWTDPKTNSRNRRDNVKYEYKGRNLTLAEWEECTGINRRTISARINRGCSVEEALTTQ